MQRILMTLVATAAITLAGCSSDDDDNNDNGNNGGDAAVVTLDTLVSQSADSLPGDDGLDQVNADLLNAFGDADGQPIELDDDETVATFLQKQNAAR